jgi:hypothetical protein
MPTQASTTARGYGNHHQQLKAKLQPTIDAGLAYCAEPICLMPDRWIEPGQPWDLAHNRDTGGYHGPAHPRCNRSEGIRHRNATRRPYRRWAL